MKKIIQLAVLVVIIGTTTNYCWQWSDLMPSRIQNWYRNWQIKRQEIQKVKKLENDYLEHRQELQREYPNRDFKIDYYKKNPKGLWRATKQIYENRETWYGMGADLAKDNATYSAKHGDVSSAEKYEKQAKYEERKAQKARDNIKLLEKYSPYKKAPSSTEIRDKRIRKISKAGWGY